MDILYPRRCLVCGQTSSYLCSHCRTLLKQHAFIPQNNSLLDGRVALFFYTWPIPALIQELKYKFVSDQVDDITNIMSTTLKVNYPNLVKYWQSQHFVFTPIPLNRFRQNWRGFNQSELISQKLAQQFSIPVIADLLIKDRYTPPQVLQQKRQNRQKNQVDAFSLNTSYLLKVPKNIVIIDDVYTTGSTILSATQKLKEYGSKTVMALTLAG